MRHRPGNGKSEAHISHVVFYRLLTRYAQLLLAGSSNKPREEIRSVDGSGTMVMSNARVAEAPALSTQFKRAFVKGDILTVSFSDTDLRNSSQDIMQKLNPKTGLSHRPTYRIAAEVKNTQPNGNLIIEGKHEFQSGEMTQTVAVSGIVRPDNISLDGTVSHDQIIEFELDIREFSP